MAGTRRERRRSKLIPVSPEDLVSLIVVA